MECYKTRCALAMLTGLITSITTRTYTFSHSSKNICSQIQNSNITLTGKIQNSNVTLTGKDIREFSVFGDDEGEVLLHISYGILVIDDEGEVLLHTHVWHISYGAGCSAWHISHISCGILVMAQVLPHTHVCTLVDAHADALVDIHAPHLTIHMSVHPFLHVPLDSSLSTHARMSAHMCMHMSTHDFFYKCLYA